MTTARDFQYSASLGNTANVHVRAMASEFATQDTIEKYICSDCILESFFSDYIQQHGSVGTCSFRPSEQEQKVLPLSEFIAHVYRALESHFQFQTEYPEGYEYYLQREGLWERSGAPIEHVIQDMAGVDDEIAQICRKVISETKEAFVPGEVSEEFQFEEDSHWKPRSIDSDALLSEWYALEGSLQTTTRFFNEHASAWFANMFDAARALTKHTNQSFTISFGPKSKRKNFYRARVFQRLEDVKRALEAPHIELGAPPPNIATAGRMNAEGISMFYGATNPEIALAEVRPPVGSWVIIGKFEAKQSLTLLNASALADYNSQGSVFDPQLLQRMVYADFFKKFADRLSRPVLPDGEKHEYIITQAIADYLAQSSEPKVDGIMYASAQTSRRGQNIVLFSSRSKISSLFDGDVEWSTEARTHDNDEDRIFEDYSVRSSVWPRDKTGATSRSLMRKIKYGSEISTLKLDQNALMVRRVTEIQYNSEFHDVSWHTESLSEPPNERRGISF